MTFILFIYVRLSSISRNLILPKKSLKSDKNSAENKKLQKLANIK